MAGIKEGDRSVFGTKDFPVLQPKGLINPALWLLSTLLLKQYSVNVITSGGWVLNLPTAERSEVLINTDCQKGRSFDFAMV